MRASAMLGTLLSMVGTIGFTQGHRAQLDNLIKQLPERDNRMVRRYGKRGRDPRINVWTGKPHEHNRERARNLGHTRRVASFVKQTGEHPDSYPLDMYGR